MPPLAELSHRLVPRTVRRARGVRRAIGQRGAARFAARLAAAKDEEAVAACVPRSRVNGLATAIGVAGWKKHPDPLPPYTMYLIYRRANTPFVRAAIASCPNAPRIALWAIDELSPELEALTVGQGPGLKFDLLNRMIDMQPPESEDYVVVADDDVVLGRGGIEAALRIIARGQFGLAQLGHAECSFYARPLVRRRVLSVARLTTFVEIGPVFIVSPKWRPRIMPFEEGSGMGWGLDYLWTDLVREGCRLGVVDWVPLRHCAPAGHSYGQEREHARRDQILGSLGDQRAPQFRTLQTWRPWQRWPEWQILQDVASATDLPKRPPPQPRRRQ